MSFYCQEVTVKSIVLSYIYLLCFGVESNPFVSNLLLADDNITVWLLCAWGRSQIMEYVFTSGSPCLARCNFYLWWDG